MIVRLVDSKSDVMILRVCTFDGKLLSLISTVAYTFQYIIWIDFNEKFIFARDNWYILNLSSLYGHLVTKIKSDQ